MVGYGNQYLTDIFAAAINVGLSKNKDGLHNVGKPDPLSKTIRETYGALQIGISK